MTRSFLANLATFLFALVAASLIWAVATRESDVVQPRLLQIPVEVVGLPADSQISNNPSTVEIRIEGPKSVVDTVSDSDFRAEINVTDLPAGEHELPVQVNHDNNQITIDFQSPERVLVRVERIITRSIPVQLDVRGEVARGYAQGDPFVDPDTIQVTGVASRVEPLAEARIDIFLDSPREDVVRTRTPTFYNRLGEIASISGLTLSTREVQVTVPVDEQAGYAVKPIIVDWTGEPAPGYRVLNVSANPDSVLVTGRPTQIEQLSFLRTEIIDISGLKESVLTPAALRLPDGITLEDVQSVIVTIEIEPIITTNVLRKAPEIRNLGEGLTATLDIDEVVVFVAGPFDKLEALTDDDVLVTLDLFGLGVGTHRVPPEAVVLVNDIELRSLQPSEVTVLITDVLTVTNELTETLQLSLLPATATPPAGASSPPTLPAFLFAALIPAGYTLKRRAQARG